MLILNKCNNTKPNWSDQAFRSCSMDTTTMNLYIRLRNEMGPQVWRTMERKLRQNKTWIRQLDFLTARLSVGKSLRIQLWWAIRTHSSNIKIDETGCLHKAAAHLITTPKTNGKLLVQVPPRTRIDKPNIRCRTTPVCTDLRCLELLQLLISTVPTIGKVQRIPHKDLSPTLARTICMSKTAVCSCIKVIFRIRYLKVKMRNTDTIKATSSSSTTIGDQMNSHVFELRQSKLMLHWVH